MSKNNKKYNIYRWDSVLYNTTNPMPMIYIKPDENLIKFVEENDKAIMVNISDSASVYDGRNITGVFTKSSTVPNRRDNFFEKTGLYVISLDSHWYGYPDSLGECEIFGSTGGVTSTKKLRGMQLTQPDIQDSQVFNTETDSIGIESVIVGIVIMSLLVLYSYTK